MPDDKHYWKYRVYHEPESNKLIGHPVPVDAVFQAKLLPNGEEEWKELEEVEGTFFVLRPENDHHARVAIAAYAYSCRKDLPHLAADLIGMIEALEWEEETGQHRDDFPIDSDDRVDEEGKLTEASVSYLHDRSKE